MESKDSKSIKDEEMAKKKKFYSNEVQNYIKKNMEDKDYMDLITKNPNELFASVDAVKLANMEVNLYHFISPSGKGVDEDVLSVELNREDQLVIENDCKRTRVRESELVPNFKETLEKLLTYYCNVKKIYYKQGLNEIFGPLLLLKYKFPTMKLSTIFGIGEVFIDKFLPNYFYEKEFFSLKSALGLFVILLRYHEPSVYNRLDYNEVVPEMYATNWVMTFLSAKIRLNLIYDYWEEIIKTGDNLILHFILVSIIKLKREMIINCDTLYLASLMTSLTIQSKEDIELIMKTALELREQTPYSFRILANKIGFLKTNNKDIKNTYDKYKPQSIPAMPIFPLEILSLTFKTGIECVDPECKNNKKKKAFSSLDHQEYCIIEHEEKKNTILNFEKYYGNHICEKCDMKIEKKIQYILLDLRILQFGGNEEDDELDKTGFLPKMINVDQEELKSPDFSQVITARFVPERGLYHFIFLTSTTDTFSEFENFYLDNTTEDDRMKRMCGLLKQTKVDKELNLDGATKTIPPKQIYKLKEYDNMRSTLNYMQKENFPYVGYVYGGFKEIHEESYLQDIILFNHNEDTCLLCLEKFKKKKHKNKEKEKFKDKDINLIKNELWSSTKKIKFEDLQKLITNNNLLLLCTIVEYKEKPLNYSASIALIEEKYTLEIYKFAQIKHYVDKQTEINKDYLEQKQKNCNYYDLGKESNDKNIELTLLEEIKISYIIEIKAESKNKNIINLKVKEDILDKKLIKKKGINYTQHLIKIDFPSANESKKFVSAFKIMTTNFKSKYKKKNK